MVKFKRAIKSAILMDSKCPYQKPFHKGSDQGEKGEAQMSNFLTSASDEELIRELSSRIKAASSLRALKRDPISESFDLFFNALEALGRSSIDLFAKVLRWLVNKILFED